VAQFDVGTRMMSIPNRRARLMAGVLVLATLAAGCGGKKDIPTGIEEADKFLFEQGTEALNKSRWFTARQFFSRLVDNYPDSVHRPDAKLGVGDSFLGEATTESLVMAANEFREFLSFYPTHRRADYAQYKLGYVHYAKMRGAARDQTETRAAIEEWDRFIERYPNSPLMPEVRAKLREARDRFSLSEYQVGYFYYRQRWYPAAIDRFKDLLNQDPLYTGRDAVYYYLGEALVKSQRSGEALPYFDRLVQEFTASEYLDRAKKRLDEFKSMTPPADAAESPAPSAAPAPSSPSDTSSTATPSDASSPPQPKPQEN
jgi:outer membrane protein assembly factor BamD